MTILDDILLEKRKEVSLLKRQPLIHTNYNSVPTFREIVNSATKMNIIAEFKRSSPSKGAIQMALHPAAQAKEYESLGAGAISVLTDKPFFNGSMEDLREIRTAVNLPILCKDFMIDPIQIDHAKAAGANIILLIVAALDHDQLTNLYDHAIKSDLEVLVEVHNEDEMERALNLNAKMIGINNRNLKTFEVDLQTTNRLASMVTDPEIILISESGIRTHEDVSEVGSAGANVVLIGETLMRSTDLSVTFEELRIPLRTIEE